MPERKIFEKIVAGGQTGADQAALDAALELGHPSAAGVPSIADPRLALFQISTRSLNIAQPSTRPGLRRMS